jgi:hypothetical protein
MGVSNPHAPRTSGQSLLPIAADDGVQDQGEQSDIVSDLLWSPGEEVLAQPGTMGHGVIPDAMPVLNQVPEKRSVAQGVSKSVANHIAANEEERRLHSPAIQSGNGMFDPARQGAVIDGQLNPVRPPVRLVRREGELVESLRRQPPVCQPLQVLRKRKGHPLLLPALQFAGARSHGRQSPWKGTCCLCFTIAPAGQVHPIRESLSQRLSVEARGVCSKYHTGEILHVRGLGVDRQIAQSFHTYS